MTVTSNVFAIPFIKLYCISGILLMLRIAELVAKSISTLSINLSPSTVKNSRFEKFDTLFCGL